VSRKAGAVLLVLLIALTAAYAFAPPSARAVNPYATGAQTISSSPHVYAQTAAEYSSSWSWVQQSPSYDYYWYIYTSGGTLVASGHNASGGGGSWSGPANIYYFKEYNNEPLGSGHINTLQVSYCC
jgi:hypothetical protein